MKKRFLCWDESLIEKSENISVVMHKPEKKNIALICDHEWEGPHNGFACVVKTADICRIYYRADASRHRLDKRAVPRTVSICVSESRDGGITFKMPNIGKYDYNGTKNNNIIFQRDVFIDNFSVFYDINPNCPKNEKFKALCEYHLEGQQPLLIYHASEDGYHFREMYALDIEGTFDTCNVTFWDENTEQYFLYYRAFHTKEGEDKLNWKGANPDWIRDIRVATSKDFKNWTQHGRITFEEGQEDMQMYTNQIMKYFRNPSTFIGFPIRYTDRASEMRNFHFMPMGDRHEAITKVFGREGTAVTDCLLMTSNDGFVFNRRDEAFLTPGVENRNNWWYGNCYTAYGMIETEAEEEGAPNEISLYVAENYRIKSTQYRRCTLRMDGFYSWYAPFKGGEVLTKPLTIDGDELHINFATSAAGTLLVSLCDEDGNALEGYTSYTMFGDTVDRPVEFEKSLSALKGETVRLKFHMKDAQLYSFIFED
ncbi:MAG: hypothetical protein IJ489_04700 [Clostridia bacterium]|nr:hypothetical protein [Clostridia bacterium]